MTHAAYHITEETLLSYAAGMLAEAPSGVVAAHLPGCTRCRSAVAALEIVGGALLDEIAPVPMSAEALSLILARL